MTAQARGKADALPIGERVGQIDAVRAIAALSILLFHSLGVSGAFGDPSFFFPLDSGVTVFFVISGFLLYRPFVRSHASGAAVPRTGAYAIRRFFRILPPYWFALTVSAIVLSWSYVFTVGGFRHLYLLTQVYQPIAVDRSAISPAWTLSIEVSFYVFIPFWAWLVRRLGSRRSGNGALGFHAVALAILFAASVVYQLCVLGLVDHGLLFPVGNAWFSLPAQLATFAIGMGLAVLKEFMAANDTPGVVAWLQRNPLVCWALVVACFVLATQLAVPAVGQGFSNREYALRMILYSGIAFGLVFPAAIGSPDRSLVSRALSAPAAVWLGLVSYGLYLWHWPVIVWISKHYPQWSPLGSALTWVISVFVITTAIAALTYRFVERPSIAVGRRMSARGGRSDQVRSGQVPAEHAAP